MSAPKDPEKRELWKRKISEALKGRIPWNKGTPRSEATKRKISESLRGNIPWSKGKTGIFSDAILRKMSECHRGQIPWNKGKTGVYSEETLERFREIGRTRKVSEATIEAFRRNREWRLQRKENHPMYGKHHSKETKRKMREASLGEKNPMYGQHHSEETKRRIGEGHKGLIPDEKTRIKMSQSQKGLRIGAKSPLWKGGISPLQPLIRNQAIYKLWIKAVFIRDHFQCQDCGKIGVHLQAHHTYPFAQLLRDYNITSVGQAIRTEELFDIALGVTLCIKCHKKRHKKWSQTLAKEIKNFGDSRHTPRNY